jgi:hypothetical protein
MVLEASSLFGQPGRAVAERVGMNALLLWSLGPRRLVLYTDGPHRVVVLAEGRTVLWLRRLPARG